MNDTLESSALIREYSLEFEDRERKNKFTDQHKFNKYKFVECTHEDLSSSIDEATLREQWLKKVEAIDKLVQEFKGLQVEHLERSVFYSCENHNQDRQIVELSFDLINCCRQKITNNLTSPDLKSKEHLDTFYSLLIPSMNDWLNVIQSGFEHLYSLFEENSQVLALANEIHYARKLAESSEDQIEKASVRSTDFGPEDEKKEKQKFCDYKRQMVVLLNKFNREVVKRIKVVSERENADYSAGDEFEDSLNMSNRKLDEMNFSGRSLSPLNSSGRSAVGRNQSSLFKRLHCLSLEENGIKHEFAKSSGNIKKALFPKVNLSVLLKELNLLRSSLPSTGIYFRTFEERLDLLSLMIEGPAQTPYENHLFLFDLQITDQLQEAPDCIYLSFGKKQLNPNLYPDGNVCLSLLGTFFSKSENEKWQPGKSSLLQLALSLQALVLNSNPFFNEADFDVYSNTVEGVRKSKAYNEFLLCQLIDHSTDLMRKRAHLAFRDEIEKHYQANAFAIYKRLYDFICVSMNWAFKCKQAGEELEAESEQFKQMLESEYPEFIAPQFYLLPASEGFCLTLSKNLKSFPSFFMEHLPAGQIEIMDKQIDTLISLIEV